MYLSVPQSHIAPPCSCTLILVVVRVLPMQVRLCFRCVRGGDRPEDRLEGQTEQFTFFQSFYIKKQNKTKKEWLLLLVFVAFPLQSSTVLMMYV